MAYARWMQYFFPPARSNAKVPSSDEKKLPVSSTKIESQDFKQENNLKSLSENLKTLVHNLPPALEVKVEYKGQSYHSKVACRHLYRALKRNAIGLDLKEKDLKQQGREKERQQIAPLLKEATENLKDFITALEKYTKKHLANYHPKRTKERKEPVSPRSETRISMSSSYYSESSSQHRRVGRR